MVVIAGVMILLHSGGSATGTRMSKIALCLAPPLVLAGQASLSVRIVKLLTWWLKVPRKLKGKLSGFLRARPRHGLPTLPTFC